MEKDLEKINPFCLSYYSKETRDDKKFALNILKNKNYYPILKIKYFREYYYYDKIRITVDSKINYELYNDNNFSFFDNSKILELKTNEKNFSNLKNLSSKIPFMISRNSKYLTGLNSCRKVYYYF